MGENGERNQVKTPSNFCYLFEKHVEVLKVRRSGGDRTRSNDAIQNKGSRQIRKTFFRYAIKKFIVINSAF